MQQQQFDYIRKAVSRELILNELTKEKFARATNKGGNLVYIVNAHNSPHIMQEIGRLRELAFALRGGGTGKSVDIDNNDTTEICYQQLIVYSPEDQEIIGGYRFIDGATVTQSYLTHLSTAKYFYLSDNFLKNYLPFTLELGRSWVNPLYQPTNNPRKGIFALDNLWDGLGAIVTLHPHMKYFFGKVTMYKNYNIEAKMAVLGFMSYFFGDQEKLVWPINPLFNEAKNHKIVSMIKGLGFKEAMKILQKYCRENDENIPPLINNYMQLSPSMKSFGTAQNPDFGDVDETGILVTLQDIYQEKRDRHIVNN